MPTKPALDTTAYFMQVKRSYNEFLRAFLSGEHKEPANFTATRIRLQHTMQIFFESNQLDDIETEKHR